MRMKRVMQELYQEEDRERQVKTKTLSIAVEVDEASMLRAISDRFGKSLSSFAGEFLEDVTRELFMYLTDEDKRELAKKADKETQDYLEKQGVDLEWVHDFNGSYGRWQIIASDWINNKLTPDDVSTDEEQSE